MVPLTAGLDYDWIIEQTAKCIEELVSLVRPDSQSENTQRDLLNEVNASVQFRPASLTLTCKSGDSLDHIADASIDCVVMDPPYYDNVMYAELSDFFYVWLKRTAGTCYPELFTGAADRQGERGGRQPGQVSTARRAPRRSQGGTTRIAWRPSSPRCRRVLSRTAS